MMEKANGDGDGDGDGGGDDREISIPVHSLTPHQQSPLHEPDRAQSLVLPLAFDGFNLHSTGPVVPEVYFYSYQPFPDTNLSVSMNMSSYPYSLPDIDTMALQHNLLELDVLKQLTTRDELSCSPTHENPTSIPESQPSLQHYSAPPNQLHSPKISPKKISFPLVASAAPTNGYAHTMLPPMIHPNPANSETRTFNQRVANTASSQADPYAAGFLQQQLGPEKWIIFSARLSERRLGQPKSKSKPKFKSSTSMVEHKPGCASVDFLVKVEVVKEILRTYVPHPYNPLKSLAHPYKGSPTGSVTLTRSVVLVLSGWSNTQFSYWARRAEAIAVLGQYDDRLRAVGTALERRLHGKMDQDTPLSPEQEMTSLPVTFLVAEEDQYHGITGKGLDIIIDDVKRRTGASQFLRGKHSSLDPYGSSITDAEEGKGGVLPAGVYNATFQAMEYTHSPPPPARPPSPKAQRHKSRRARRSESSHLGTVLNLDTPNMYEVSFTVTGSRAQNEGAQSPSSSTFPSVYIEPTEAGGEPAMTPCMPARRPRGTAPRKSSQANNQRSRLPVSDSRFEIDDTTPLKRKCHSSYTHDSGSPKKKMR